MSMVSRKHQITIPVDVMRASGIEPGDDVQIRVAGPGRVEVIKTADVLGDIAGAFDSSVFPEGYLEEVRSGWG
jgi:bifunctional DNA-binding transcriptional regulator/antitoxin component of YhaV-PrlF toxin-antitoxin module